MSHNDIEVGSLIKINIRKDSKSEWVLPGTHTSTGVVLDFYENEEGIRYASIFWNDQNDSFLDDSVFWYPVSALQVIS